MRTVICEIDFIHVSFESYPWDHSSGAKLALPSYSARPGTAWPSRASVLSLQETCPKRKLKELATARSITRFTMLLSDWLALN
jgi:hypothetical protein